MIKRINLFILLVFFTNILTQNVNLKSVSAQENVNLEINLVNAITGTAPFNTTGAGPGLHPGDDYSADDNYVRTLDIITYELHYSVNPAGGVANNAVITSTIPLNAEGKTVAVWEDKLTTMYPGLTISNDGRTLTYNIGDVKAGNAYTFSPTAKVLTTAANGETFSVSASITADNASGQTTQPYTATVSALPKVDLIKQLDQGVDALGPNGEKGKVYTFAIGLTVGDAKGGEAIPGTITFTDDLSAFGLPNARLYDFDGNPAVGVNGVGRGLVAMPYGKTTGSIPNEGEVAGTPTISATQASPGANVNISISNIDQEGRHFPTENWNGTPIPSDKKYIFSGYIALWVDDNDIPLGNTSVTNKYTNLSLNGASGTPNYGGQSEPLDNNVVAFNVFKSNEGRFGATYLSYTKSPSEYAKLPTQVSMNSGDGVVYPGQTFGLYATGGNGGNIPLNNYEMLVKIDPTKLKITDLEGKPGVAYVLRGTPGLEDILQVQYGTGTYDSFDIQRDDTAEGATWYNSTTEALASGTGPINKVRLIAKPGKSVPSNTSIDFGLNVTALNNPINTVIPSVMAVRADEVDGGKWRISRYDPNNHNLDLGDRLYITEVLTRVQKDTQPTGIKTSEVNKEVTFKLTPTLTTDSRYSNITNVENVTITDTLPKGLTYVNGSSSLEPDSVVKNQDGTTTIKWTLTNVNINDSIEPILYKTHVDFDVKNATILENKTVISTPLDSSAEALRTSKYGLNIVNLSAWGIAKSTPTPTVELGDDLTYTLKYAVFKEEAFSDFNFIDILPYNGDTRTPATSFNGGYTIKELSGTNGETFYFTTDPQSSINRDPSLNTNTWIPYTPEVASGKNITAIKIHANTLTSTDGAKEVTVKLAPANNKGGDIYTNNFSGRVSNVNAIVYSNDVPITVTSSSIGDYVWNDANGNGVKDSGESGIANVTVNLLDQQGNKIVSTVTNSEGYYSFNELHSGNYQVKVDESTLPNNFIQTYDLDKVLDNSTTIQLDADTKCHDANFGYKEKLGNLVVKYLEQGTNKELAPETTGKEKVGTDYTTVPEVINGYKLVSIPSNATGKYVDGTVEVIYYYTKTIPWTPLEPSEKLGNLVVKYLEQGTNKELAPESTGKEKVGTDYTTTAETIDGYTLVSTPSNATGKYVDGTVEVIYYYTKTIPWTPLEPSEKLGNLVVKYLEQGTNKELAPETTGKEKVGTDYTTMAETIDGYTLVSTPSNATGKYVDGTVEVIYYYTKTIPWTPLEPSEKLGNLVVKYLEQGTNKELAPESTGKEKVGTDYTTTAETIDGYKLVSIPSNATGKYVDGTVEVIYYYTKTIPWTPLEPSEKLGNLVVKYLEQGTNKELASQITDKKLVGTEYSTTKKDIDGYELVVVPSNEKGKYIDGTVEVIYYYVPKKVIESQDTVPQNTVSQDTAQQDKINEGTLSLPKTGNEGYILYYILGALFLIVGLRLTSRKSKKI